VFSEVVTILDCHAKDHITELAALKLRQADTVSVMAAPRSLSDEKLAPANGSLGRAQSFFTFLQ